MIALSVVVTPVVPPTVPMVSVPLEVLLIVIPSGAIAARVSVAVIASIVVPATSSSVPAVIRAYGQARPTPVPALEDAGGQTRLLRQLPGVLLIEISVEAHPGEVVCLIAKSPILCRFLHIENGRNLIIKIGFLGRLLCDC